MKLLAHLGGQEINVKENAGLELLSVLAFPSATSTMNSTTLRIQSSLLQSPQLQKQPYDSCRCLRTRRWNVSYTLPRMLWNNSRNKIHCLHFMAPGRGPLQQSYLKQAVPPEAITDNNSWSNKIKKFKRIRKSQGSIAPEVANHRQTKILGLNQVATTITGTTGRK